MSWNYNWNCKGCNFRIYGHKTECIKCNLDRHGNLIDVSDKVDEVDDDKLCIICMMQPKNSIFLHGTDAHNSCCYACASKIMDTTKNCPICRQKIEKIIKIY